VFLGYKNNILRKGNRNRNQKRLIQFVLILSSFVLKKKEFILNLFERSNRFCGIALFRAAARDTAKVFFGFTRFFKKQKKGLSSKGSI